MSDIRRGVAIVHYNRTKHLKNIIEAVHDTTPEGIKVVVCDDGSTETVELPSGNILIQGKNLGVAANKNRALWALQDCHFLAILEDDLLPTKGGWFEAYETAACISQEQHFCRVQDKEIPETVPDFTNFMARYSLHPVFGSSPRGDLTFITSDVVRVVGGFNTLFRGAGYAHGEWSDRVARAGLVKHPLKWMDILEARDSFSQIGDREGGRWEIKGNTIRKQLQANAKIRTKLNETSYIYHPLVLE